MKKIFTLISVLSISTASLMAQADTASSAANWKATPNPGFENWTHVTGINAYDDANGWNDANSQSAITGTFGCQKASTPNIKTGTYAVKLSTASILGIIAPGIVTTGTVPTSSSGSITGGIAYTLRPDSIVGWYKGTPQGSDYAFAAFFVFGSAANNADTVGTASFNAPKSAVTTFTRFSAPIVYRNADPIVNSIWLLSSSGNTTVATAGSNAFFDDIAIVINSTVGIATQTNTSYPIGVSPNPASNHVLVTNVANANNNWSLFDITGRKVAEQKLASGFNSLDIAAFTNGLYIYTITDENSATVKTGKLIIQK